MLRFWIVLTNLECRDVIVYLYGHGLCVVSHFRFKNLNPINQRQERKENSFTMIFQECSLTLNTERKVFFQYWRWLWKK